MLRNKFEKDSLKRFFKTNENVQIPDLAEYEKYSFCHLYIYLLKQREKNQVKINEI